MEQEQISLVKSTWGQVLYDEDDVGMAFYDRLFEANPSLRVLFKNDLRVQAEKLISMLSSIVNHLDHPNQIKDMIHNLSKRHYEEYGVKDTHFKLVGEALLYALEKSLGSRWNEEIEQAWKEAYRFMSNLIINARHVSHE